MKSFLAFLSMLIQAVAAAVLKHQNDERSHRAALQREKQRVDDDAKADHRARTDPNGVLLDELDRQQGQ